MTINPRLLLLAVIAALFVRVWSVNERPRESSAPRRGARSAAEVRKAHETALPGAATTPWMGTASGAGVVEERWTPATCPIRLNISLPAGSYRVAGSRGRVARLDVIRSDAPENDGRVWEMQSPDGERWHFIVLGEREPALTPEERLAVALGNQTPSSTQVADDSPAPVRPNRKFDFTGYLPAPAAAPGVPPAVFEQAARPAAPELPTPR